MDSLPQVLNKHLTKNKKVEFAVGGNCEQCKARIEKAAYSVKGVKSANWNIKSGNMTLIFDERKCSESDVQKAIAKVGHDAGKERADVKCTKTYTTAVYTKDYLKIWVV